MHWNKYADWVKENYSDDEEIFARRLKRYVEEKKGWIAKIKSLVHAICVRFRARNIRHYARISSAAALADEIAARPIPKPKFQKDDKVFIVSGPYEGNRGLVCDHKIDVRDLIGFRVRYSIRINNSPSFWPGAGAHCPIDFVPEVYLRKYLPPRYLEEGI